MFIDDLNNDILTGNGTPDVSSPDPTLDGTQTSSPEGATEYDFAGVKVQGNDPNLATAHKSYKDAVSKLQELNNEVKQLRGKANEKVNTQNQQPNTQTNSGDNRLDFVYNTVMEDKFNANKRVAYSNLQTQFGEDFKHIQPMMDKALQNLPLEQKVNVDLVQLAKAALGELQYARYTKSPEELMNTQSMQQAAVNNPNVKQQVVANELNKYQNQETLPPNMPNNVGATPMANEVKPAKTFKEAAQRAKDARKLRTQQGLRGGQGIR